MKNLFKLAGCFMLATALLACNREVDKTLPVDGETHWVKIIASPDVATRTTLVEAERSTVWSDEDLNNIYLFENGVAPNAGTFDAEIDANGNLYMIAGFSGSAPFTYTSILANDLDDESFVATIPDNQGLKIGTFDPNADILVAKPQVCNEAQDEFMFQYARVVAINKMTIKGLTNGDEVQEVVISSDKPILGSYNMSTNEWTNDGNQLVLSAKDGLSVSDGSVAVYFITAPVEGAILTINVRTAAKTYEKTFTKTINFPQNAFTTFATSVAGCEVQVAPRGTILLSETFYDFAANDVPSKPGEHTTIYNNANISYSCTNGGSDTKIFAEALAGGEAPELLVGKSTGIFAISGIPAAGNTTFTVMWNSNNTNIALFYGDDEVSPITGQDSPYQAVVTVPAGTTAINLSFKNTKSSNGRLDDVTVVAGTPLLPAGLAFSESEKTVIIGEDFEEPTLTNEHNLQVTYSSSNSSVAEVDSEGNVTIKDAGTATIMASSAQTDEYYAGQASYTITAQVATLSLSNETTPAKAACAADATVTFTVTSNIDWTAAKETDSDNIVKSVTWEGNVVTVTFNKNTATQEKTAVIAVTPTKEVFASLKKTIIVTQEKFENTDVLTATLIGKTSYADWSGLSVVSSAVYAGNSTKNSSGDIQMRGSTGTQDPSGIVSTTSGGYIRKVKITWGTGNASDGRILNIYGSHTKYSSAADLYVDGLTPIATLNSNNGTVEYSFTSDYEYVGVRSASGALYLADIAFTWEEVDPNVPKFGAAIVGNANIAADVTSGTVQVTGNVAWTASVTTGASVSPTSGEGEGTITVTMPENESYTDPANYVVTVTTTADVPTKTFNLTFTQDPAVDPNQPNGSLERPYRATDVLGITSATGVYVTGTISELGEFSDSYHNYSYTITDGTSSALVFRGKYLGGDDFTSADQLSVGDEVIVYGNIGQYQGVSQLNQNNYLYSLNGVTKLPTITKTDITGVSANGVTGATTSVTFADSDGWTPSVTPDGTIVTAASISGTTITYTVAKNTGSVRSGSIIVTLSRSGFSDVSATIDVSQDSSITPTYGTITITRSSFPAGALAYNVTDAWSVTASTGETITGEGDLYSTTNQSTMQSKNSGVSTMYHNTVATPGPITKITLTCASGTARTYTAYMNKTEVITSTSGGTNKGTIAPAVGQSKSLELSASDGWYYFWLNLAGGSSSLDSIEIEYLVTD